MNLNRKTLTILAIVFIVLISLIYLMSNITLLEDYDRLEKELFREDMKRIVNIVQGDIDDLKYITTDWAQWDDTYEFVVEKNKRFTDSNITDTTFEELRLNFISRLSG